MTDHALQEEEEALSESVNHFHDDVTRILRITSNMIDFAHLLVRALEGRSVS